ncbi:Calmodulin-binding protein 60 B [Linum grandiflorum]
MFPRVSSDDAAATGSGKHPSPKLEFHSDLGPMIRSQIRDEVNKIIQQARGQTSLGVPAEGLVLQFVNKIPSTIFTGSKIEAEDGSPVRIQLLDASSNTIVKSGPFSSLKVEITVLNGDFVSEDWSDRDFSNNVIRERDGRRPLVTGELNIVLSDGVGQLSDLAFTDNSSWIRCRQFRLGAKPVQKSTSGEVIRIREGRSEPFVVKDQRGEAYKKNYPPRLGDEVWRLEKVAKGGALHNRLSSFGINTVKELLQANGINQSALRNQVAGGVISNKVWDKILEHASTCEADESKFYVYGKHGEGVRLLFDHVYKLVAASFDDDQSYIPLDKLTRAQKLILRGQETIRPWVEMVPVDSSSVAFTSVFPSEEGDDERKSVSSFVSKTYQLVGDPVTDNIVSWGEDGSTFIVWIPAEFARDILPKYFKHGNFTSFVRQLNTFGFRKSAPDRWEFANEFFKKGEEHLLCQIKRRKTQTFLKKDESIPRPDSISSQSSCLYNDSGISKGWKWNQETSAVPYSASCASEVTTCGQEWTEEVASHVSNWLSLSKPEPNLKAKSAWRKIRTALKLTSFLSKRKRLTDAAKADALVQPLFRLQTFERKQLKDKKPDEPVEAAALKIQNKFRSWKARKEFLVIQQQVVKIQAHVRGHQARENYKKNLWSLSIVEKVVLRWKRNKSALREFGPELVDGSHSSSSSSIQPHLSAREDDYDFFNQSKTFQRKQVDVKLSSKSDDPAEAAAVRIQNKFRSWKARKEFIGILRKIVKIQAHVRGHHVRRNIKVISSSVGIVKKVVLRRKRNRCPLRGFPIISERPSGRLGAALLGGCKHGMKMKDLKLQLQSFTDLSKHNLHSYNSVVTQEIYISKYPSFQISAHNFVSLLFPYCNLRQLWNGGEQLLVNLKSMDLNHSNLFEIPNLSKAKKLETVNLEGCVNLVGVSSIQYLTKLENLNLKGCRGLKRLPSLIRLKFLNTLDLSYCSSLTRLPPSLGCLPNLCELNLRNCRKLDYLPRTVMHLMRSLENLNVSGCYSLWKPVCGDLEIHNSLVSKSTEETYIESQLIKPVDLDAAGDSPSQDLSSDFKEMRQKEAIEWELDEDASMATPLIDFLPSGLRTRLLLPPAMDFSSQISFPSSSSSEGSKIGGDLQKEDQQQLFEDKDDLGDTTRTVSVSCQVEDCGVDLSRAETYHQHHRICHVHCQASNALVEDVLQRFCLQCCRFHILEDFNDEERNCRSRLAGYHQKQRRQSIESTEDTKPDESQHKRRKDDDEFGSIENDVLEMCEQLSSWNEAPESVLAWLAEMEQSVPETVTSMKIAKAEAEVAGEKLKEMDARLVVGRVELSLLDKAMSRILEEEEEIEAELQVLMEKKKRREILMQQQATE